MSISFGNKNVKEMYFGNKKVAKVYFGNKLVWPKMIGNVMHIADCAHDHSHAAFVIHIDEDCRLKEIKYYTLRKVSTISNKFTISFINGPVGNTNIRSPMNVLAAGNFFHLVSSAKSEYVTENGEAIYLTVIKVGDDNGLVLTAGDYFIVPAAFTSDSTMCRELGYLDDDTIIARWQFDWNIPTQPGEWTGDADQNGVIANKFIRAELTQGKVFDNDPIPDAIITPKYSKGLDTVTWTIKTNDIDVAGYVENYAITIDDTTYTVTGGSGINSWILPSGFEEKEYTASISAISAESGISQTVEFIIDRTPGIILKHAYLTDGPVPYIIYDMTDATEDVTLTGYSFYSYNRYNGWSGARQLIRFTTYADSSEGSDAVVITTLNSFNNVETDEYDDTSVQLRKYVVTITQPITLSPGYKYALPATNNETNNEWNQPSKADIVFASDDVKNYKVGVTGYWQNDKNVKTYSGKIYAELEFA